MTPAIGFIFAGLFAVAPMTQDSTRSYQANASDIIYECPPTYKLAKSRDGQVICLRYKRDLAR